MKIGCGTVLFRTFALERSLAAIREIGYEYFETQAVGPWCPHVNVEKDDPLALVRLKETDEHGNPIADVENEVMISYTPVTGAYMFAPGNKYKVKFRIFGLTHVMANVTLEPWHKGGDLDVDTENDKPNL